MQFLRVIYERNQHKARTAILTNLGTPVMTTPSFHSLFVLMRSTLFTASIFVAFIGHAQAGIIFFTDQATFDAAAPGLAIEDFNSSLAGTGDVISAGSIIDASSSSSAFQAGDILPGIAISASTGVMVSLGAGVGPNTTPAVAADLFSASSVIDFSEGVTAIGLEVFDFFGGNITLNFLGASGGLLGSVNVPSSSAFQFVGAISDAPVFQVQLGNSANVTVVDNVAFGNTVSVPSPSALSLIGLGLVFLGWKRRK